MAEENHCPQCGAELPADAPQGMCPKCLMKLGLPTGAEADKADASEPTSDVPTSATPPGSFSPPEPAELAKQFPQLEILELLGQGGMGAVYKARQKQLERMVALKILPPQVAQTEAFAERFTREARSLAKLNHPRIVSVYDFGHTEDGLYYFIMEFIDGTDLRHVIQAGELSAAESLAIVPQICEALQFAHEEGIVHRDIKPENILLDKKGRVKIADFGLAKLLDRPATVYTLTQAGQRMGTPHYMAPEQIEHPGQVDHRADIFSLGVVFYEMLTGELPLGRFAPPSQKVQVDVRLDKVVLHSLEKEPERRYQHASEVKTDVEVISSGPEPVRPVVAADVTQVSRMEKHVTLVAVINIVFGGLGIAIGLMGLAAISGGGLISGDIMAMRITRIVGPAVALFFFLTSVPEVIAGIGLLKRKSWARILAIIIAILDLIYIPIGTAIGIYELWVLLNDETARLFAQASARTKKEWAVQTKQKRGKLVLAIVLIAVVFLFAWAFTLLIIFGWPVIFSSTSNRQSPQISVESYSASEQVSQLDLPYGAPEDLTFEPEGLTLSDQCIQALELEPSEAAQVHKILRRAYRQYLELERRNTQQYRAVNTLTVTIFPFRQEAESFLKQLWADLDSILDEQKRTLARRHLPLGQMFGTFQFGGPEVMIVVTEAAGTFLYSTVYKWPKGESSIVGRSSVDMAGSGRTLPSEYRRFWEDSATDK
ncbi:MAG TPA: serine/threonine-protein kinase [Sedimentisphaerales bacterium]|nr:serine/threonine-protein kinase [Sedimentisphaerales bacterium]